MADATLALAPADVSDEEALLLGDIFSTGFFCADNAGIPELAAACSRAAGSSGAASGGTAGAAPTAAAADGPVVAVVGCGPVGLLAILGARELGAGRVLAIDSVPERLLLAQRFGAEPINREERDAVEAVRCAAAAPGPAQCSCSSPALPPRAALRTLRRCRTGLPCREATAGRGADAVLEVVGSPSALRAAYDLVRPGGTISSVGCHTGAHTAPAERCCRGAGVAAAQPRCPPHRRSSAPGAPCRSAHVPLQPRGRVQQERQVLLRPLLRTGLHGPAAAARAGPAGLSRHHSRHLPPPAAVGGARGIPHV